MSEHGGTGCLYTNAGCRCDKCTAQHRARVAAARAKRAERLSVDPSLATHGLASTYQNWGCRCDECRRANTVTSRRWVRSNA